MKRVVTLARSMTGYGKCEVVTEKKEINVEMKSVNNRYLDVNVKLPRYLMFAEEKIKKLVSLYVTRAKVDMFINISTVESSGKIVKIDKEFAISYVNAFRELCESTGIEYDLSASKFLNTDVVTIQHEEVSDEELWEELAPIIEKCLENYNEMRSAEGERLQNSILEKLDALEKYVSEIEKIIPENIDAYKNKLLEKIYEALENKEIDENRIITEVALYVDKTCVDEETVRLKSHFQAMRELLSGEEKSFGKKLDFIIQEMNRETNTIGSKANDLKISHIVVEMKNEIEKIREQIQNIE